MQEDNQLQIKVQIFVAFSAISFRNDALTRRSSGFTHKGAIHSTTSEICLSPLKFSNGIVSMRLHTLLTNESLKILSGSFHVSAMCPTASLIRDNMSF